MEILLILVLAAWGLWQHLRVNDLGRRLEEQARQIALLSPAVEARPAVAEAAPPPPAAPQHEPIILVDESRPAEAAARAAPPPRITPAPEPVPQPRPAPAPREQGRSIAAWMAENGLAWIGGGALALGGLLLAAYAAQRGFFTPGLRVGASGALGFVMLGASEWIRRPRKDGAQPHALAAAVTAGAGAATLYGAVLAAWGLYHFIDYQMATLLLALVSAGLLAIAHRHGEPLAMLAVAGAFAAPLIGLADGWKGPLPDLYLMLVAATGLLASVRRGWGRAAIETVALAALWACGRHIGDAHLASAVLAAGPLGLLLALGWRRDGRAMQLAVSGAIVAAAAALSLMAFADFVGRLFGQSANTGPWSFAAAAAVLALEAGLAVRKRFAAPILFGFMALAVVAAAAQLADLAPARGLPLWTNAALGLAAAMTLGLAGLLSGRNGVGAPAGALGLLAVCVLVTARAAAAPADAAGLAVAGAVALAAGAAWLARRSRNVGEDAELAFWSVGAAGAALTALIAGVDVQWLALPVAALAAALAVLSLRLGWRGLGAAAITVGVAAVGAVLAPDFVEPAISGAMPLWRLGLVALGAAGLLALGWRMSKGAARQRTVAEALGTEAVVVLLLGAFWLLRRLGEAGHGGLDPLTESALRTLLLLISGAMLQPSEAREQGFIARWRSHAFLALGVLHGLAAQGLYLNPWMGGAPAKVAGWPVADSLAAAYLAPALLLGLAAWRMRRRGERGGIYGGFGIAALIAWIVLELRRLFHGADLTGGLDTIGRAEAAAYATAALVLARVALQVEPRLPAPSDPRQPSWQGFCVVWSWAALALGLLVFGYTASPWWGPIEGSLPGPMAAGLFGLYLAAVLAAASMAWPAGAGGRPRLRTAAIVAALLVLFALITLVLRWLFQGADMRTPMAEESLETWTFSAVWTVYGVAVLSGGILRHNLAVRWVGLGVLLLTTAKVFLFDMATLEGVVRAASFLALGALLVGGALISRRMREASQAAPEPPDAG